MPSDALLLLDGFKRTTDVGGGGAFLRLELILADRRESTDAWSDDDDPAATDDA